MLTVFIVVVCQQSLECHGMGLLALQSSLTCYTIPPHTQGGGEEGWSSGNRD